MNDSVLQIDGLREATVRLAAQIGIAPGMSAFDVRAAARRARDTAGHAEVSSSESEQAVTKSLAKGPAVTLMSGDEAQSSVREETQLQFFPVPASKGDHVIVFDPSRRFERGLPFEIRFDSSISDEDRATWLQLVGDLYRATGGDGFVFDAEECEAPNRTEAP